MDINSAAVLIVCVMMLKLAGPYMISGLASITRDIFTSLHTAELNADSVRLLGAAYGWKALAVCLPIILAAGAVGFTANVLQIGLKATTKQITPDLDKLNPIKGFARFFSGRALVELAKTVAKIVIVGLVVYSMLKHEYVRLIDLYQMPPAVAGGVIGDICWRLLVRACLVMLVIGIIDYVYQRISFDNSIKMTKQEIKDEYKQIEGDPKIKAKIRQRQREMARRRMLQDVPKADVVITNPTHYAVAIKYNPEEMAAPTVVAKGQRLLAKRIREVAEAHGVPIVENPPVARLLYKVVEVDEQIPAELYQTVAEILAYVYRLSQKAGKSGKKFGL